MATFLLYILKVNLLVAVSICLIVALSRILKGKFSVKWKYTMWLFIAVFLLIPFNILAGAEIVKVEIPASIAWSEAGATTKAETELFGTGAETQPSKLEAEAQPAKTETVNEAINNEVMVGNTQAANVALEVEKSFAKFNVIQMATYFWAAGILMGAIIQLLSALASKKYLRRWQSPQICEQYTKIYFTICKRYHLNKYPRLAVNEKLDSPILSGLFSPTLYLPKREYLKSELEFIFQHELMHYMRKDLWYKLFLLIVRTIYWFNPFLYFMKNEAERDIEFICDSHITRRCSEDKRIEYYKLILKTATDQSKLHLSAGLNDGKTNIKGRISYMVKYKNLKKGKGLLVLFIVLLVTSNLLIGCAVTEKAEEKRPEPVAQVEQTKAPDVTLVPTEKVEPTPVAVKVNVQQYEGYYTDMDIDFSLPEEKMAPYYSVQISNITETSFDFTIYIFYRDIGKEEVIFQTNTAVFTGNGDTAKFEGGGYELDFSFSNDLKLAVPVVTIKGFDEVQGIMFASTMCTQ